jgi:rubrerythrin
MKKLGISKSTLQSRISDEQKAQRDYKKNAAQAKSNGDTKTANVIMHIEREEEEHEGMLKGLKGKGMKTNPPMREVQKSKTGAQFPAPKNKPAIAKEASIPQTLFTDRPLNQPGDSGMRPHAQEALQASLETGLGNETFRSKGGNKSSYSPDSSTGHVSRY